MENKKSIFYKNISPVYQAVAVLSAIIVFNILSLGLKALGVLSSDNETPWLIFATFILFYALINGILSISAVDPNKYWMHSILAFVVLLITGGLIAYLFSGISIDDAGSYRFLIMLFTFCYILILTIANAMKKIVKMAQKQDERMHGEE